MRNLAAVQVHRWMVDTLSWHALTCVNKQLFVSMIDLMAAISFARFVQSEGGDNKLVERPYRQGPATKLTMAGTVHAWDEAQAPWNDLES